MMASTGGSGSQLDRLKFCAQQIPRDDHCNMKHPLQAGFFPCDSHNIARTGGL